MANGDFRGQDISGISPVSGSSYKAPTVKASTMTSGYEQLKPSIDRLNTLVSDLGGLFSDVAKDTIEEERNNNYTNAISDVDLWFSGLGRDTESLILQASSNPEIAEPFSLIKDSETNLSPRHQFLFNERDGILRKSRKWEDRQGKPRDSSLDNILNRYSYDKKVENAIKRHILKKELSYTKDFEAKISAFQKKRSEDNIQYGADRIDKGIYGNLNDRNIKFGKSAFNKPKITIDEIKDIENKLGMHSWASEVITHANRQKLNTGMTIALLEERWQEILQKEWNMDYLRLINNPEGGGADELMKRLIDGYYSLEMPSYTVDKDTGEVIDQKIRKKISLDISQKTNQLSAIKSKRNSREKLKLQTIHKLNHIKATTSDSGNEIFVSEYWDDKNKNAKFVKYFKDNDLKDTPENRDSLLNIIHPALKARTAYDNANKENLIDVKTEEQAVELVTKYLIGVNKSETGRKTDPFTTHDFGKFDPVARKTLKKWGPIFEDVVLHQDLLQTTSLETFSELNKEIVDVRNREELPLVIDQSLEAVHNDYKQQIQSRKDPTELYRTASVDTSKPLTKEDYSNVDKLWKARGKEGPAPFPTTMVDGLIEAYMPVSGQDDKVRVTTPNQVRSMLKQSEEMAGPRSKQLKNQIRRELNETDPLLSSLIFDFVDGPVAFGQETLRKLLEYFATPQSDRKSEIKTYGKGGVEFIAHESGAPMMALEGDLKARGLQLYTHLANAYATSEKGTSKMFIKRAIKNFHGRHKPDGLIHTKSTSTGNTTYSHREIWGDYYDSESSKINALQHAMDIMPYKVVDKEQFKSFLHSDKGDSLGMGDFRAEVIANALYDGRISNIKFTMVPSLKTPQTGMNQVPAIIRLNPNHHNGGEIIHTFDDSDFSLGTKANPSEWVLAYGAKEYIQYVNGIWEDKSLDYIKDLKNDLENDPSVLERSGIDVDFMFGASITALQQGSVGRREIKALEYVINIAETKFKGQKDSGQKAIDYTLKRWGTTFSKFVKGTENLVPTEPKRSFRAEYNDKNQLILIEENKDIRTQNIPGGMY